jgi:hypothetical protein
MSEVPLRRRHAARRGATTTGTEREQNEKVNHASLSLSAYHEAWFTFPQVTASPPDLR